jgi:hypothetical protein
MSEYEVNCISKLGRDNTHERITHIGNTRFRWRLSTQSAIERIDAGSDIFYTADKSTGKRIYIEVVREEGKAPYLRTQVNGEWTDNLLAQAECDPDCRIFW